jgi:hypothetical protein
MRIELGATCDTDDRLVFRTADGDDLQAALAGARTAVHLDSRVADLLPR